MLTETEPEKLPPFGVIAGVATTNEAETVTLKMKLVVLVTPPPVDVTTIL